MLFLDSGVQKKLCGLDGGLVNHIIVKFRTKVRKVRKSESPEPDILTHSSDVVFG